LVGHLAGVNGVVFGPDSRLLASGGDDGTVRDWELTTGEELSNIVVVSRWFE
jgi:WD40 repeat protein